MLVLSNTQAPQILSVSKNPNAITWSSNQAIENMSILQYAINNDP